MRAKTIIGVALAVMLVLAVLPQAWAVVEMPEYGLLAGELLVKYGKLQYPEEIDKIDYVKRTKLYNWLFETLTSKPAEELTVEEAYWLEMDFAAQDDLEKTEYYFNLIMQKDPNYVPAYITLVRETDDDAKALKLLLKTLEINPDGLIVEYYGTRKETQNLWKSIGYGLGELREPYGYDIPQELIDWFVDGAAVMAEHGEIKTKDDLERIGFYEKRDEVLRALEKKPLGLRIAEALPVGGATKGVLGEILVLYGTKIAIALAVLLIFAWMAISFRRADKRAAS